MAKMEYEEHYLWVMLSQVADFLNKCSEDLSNRLGGSSRQFFMLWTMKFTRDMLGGPITISDLAPAVVRSINNISALIDRMEKNGLVKKVRNLPDRRAIRLNITPKGDEEFARLNGPQTEMVKRLLSVYTQEEMKILTELLSKLKAKAIEETNVGPAKMDPTTANRAVTERFLEKTK